jgi:hypothetical protein
MHMTTDDKPSRFSELMEKEIHNWLRNISEQATREPGRRTFSELIEESIMEWGDTVRKSGLLEKGLTYLVEDESVTEGFDVFICSAPDHLMSDDKGKYIWPIRVQDLYETGELKIDWLASIGEDSTIKSVELDRLINSITRNLDAHRDSMILIEGFEYILKNNTQETIRKILETLRTSARNVGATQIITINPNELSLSDLKLLRDAVDMVI